MATTVALVLLAVPITAAWVWRLGIATGQASIPTYSMREAKIIADHLYASGLSFSDIQQHLRGPDSIDLMYSIAAYAPSPEPTGIRPMPDLRVLAFADDKAPDESTADNLQHVDLGRGRKAWILPIDAWVGLAPSRVCYAAADRSESEECAEISSPAVPLGGRYHDLAFPSFPGVHDAHLRFTRNHPGASPIVRWELPIGIRGNAPEHHVQLASIIAPPWRIEAVEGVGFRGDLPARSVVIDRSAAMSGRLVVSADEIPSREYPPEILETQPEEGELRRSLATLPPIGPYMCGVLETCP